jgi:hypothetical protein
MMSISHLKECTFVKYGVIKTKKKKLWCIIWNYYYLWLKNNIVLFFMLKKSSRHISCFPTFKSLFLVFYILSFYLEIKLEPPPKKTPPPYISKICQIYTFHRILSKMTKFVGGKKIIGQHGRDLTNIWTQILLQSCT